MCMASLSSEEGTFNSRKLGEKQEMKREEKLEIRPGSLFLAPIQVLDGGRAITLTYEAMAAYHGGEFPAGVALGYRLVKSLSEQVPSLSRGGWIFYNGLGKNAPGITDAVEYSLRICRDGGVWSDPSYVEGIDAPLGPGGGKYYFTFWDQEVRVSMKLKDGLLPEDFFRYSKLNHERKLSGRDLAYLMDLRRELEYLLLAEPGEIFHIRQSVLRGEEYEGYMQLVRKGV